MINDREIKAVVFSFLFVVVLMSAYYILRPVRDAMASDWTDAEVSLLWTLNFIISTTIVAFYGIMVSKFRFRLLVPAMYGIFACSFIIFYFLVHQPKKTFLTVTKYTISQINFFSFIYFYIFFQNHLLSFLHS